MQHICNVPLARNGIELILLCSLCREIHRATAARIHQIPTFDSFASNAGFGLNIDSVIFVFDWQFHIAFCVGRPCLVLLEVVMLKIDFKWVFVNVFYAHNAINMAIHDIPQLKYGYKVILFLDISQVHFGTIQDNPNQRPSRSATCIGVSKALRCPLGVRKPNTIHAKHIGSAGIKDDVALNRIVDGGMKIQMSSEEKRDTVHLHLGRQIAQKHHGR